MNWIDNLPVPLRLTILAALGIGLGALVNVAVERLESAWRFGAEKMPGKGIWQRIRWSVTGGLGSGGRNDELPRTSRRHLLVTVLVACGLPALYWWEVLHQALLLPGLRPPSSAVLHAVFLSHAVLLILMAVATLIDVDEKIIPDAVTVTGAAIGLILAAVLPYSLLPDAVRPGLENDFPLLVGPGRIGDYRFLHLASPYAWPAALNGWPQVLPLLLGLACWWLWCFALMPRTWYIRRGWRRAVVLMFARLCRSRATYLLLAMGVIGSAGIVATWYVNGDPWRGLISSLVGLAAGGGLVWTVRIVGSLVLNREAMGFGDVTLVGMIGAFLGWQASLLLFFVAPFAGLVVGLVVLVIHRDSEIPYGPFLCLAALLVILRWPVFWAWATPLFALGATLLLMLIFTCVVGMGFLLLFMRLIRERFGGYAEGD